MNFSTYKNIFFCLLILLGCTQAPARTPKLGLKVPEQKETKNLKNLDPQDNQTHDPLNNTEKLTVSLLILTAALIVQDPTLIVTSYARDAITYLAHELGHAIAAKILWNNPIQIGLGASQPKKTGSIIKTKHFILESWYPAGGYLNYTDPMIIDPITGTTRLDTTKQAIMHASGGICGALAHLTLNMLIAKAKGKKMLDANHLYDYGIAEQLLDNVIIPNNSADGFKNDARVIIEDCLNMKAPEALIGLNTWGVRLLCASNFLKKGTTQQNLQKEKEFFVRKVLQMVCLSDE